MLRFKLRQPDSGPVEVFGTSPDTLAPLSLETVRRHKVYAGNRALPLGELFEVSGDPAAARQHWSGDLATVDGIGYGMTFGQIAIDGHAGHHVGARMSGGTIRVQGNVADHPGCEMAGGLIHVQGNAGDGVGGAGSGSRNGQNGGAILIQGSAGNGAGQLMRRGVIAIAGDVGNCCGWLMRAGNIWVAGKTGNNIGAEMQRGTIVLMQDPGEPPPGFDPAGAHSMPVTDLLNRYLHHLGMAMSFARRRYQVFHGDRLHGARGELLVARDEF